MSLSSRYSDKEIRCLSKEEYMREATYLDMTKDLGVSFKVAYLARESTRHTDQIKALKVQIQMLEEFIEKRGHFILSEDNKFVEEGKSGLCMDYRQVFLNLLEVAKRNKFDILVVDAVSRLARNVGELFSSIDMLKNYGIGILILKGEYWTYNMSYNDILRLAIEAGLAQAESMQTAKRVKDHMQTISQNGQLLGGDMFGYRLKKAVERVNNTLEIMPTEAYTIKMIFEKYTSDDPDEVLSTSGLVPYLIKNNMLTYEGDLNWTASKIRRILMNEKYMGYQMYGKSKVVDTVAKKKVLTKIEPIREDILDKDGNIIQKCNLIRGNWEPIVSEELWWKAYNVRQGRSAEIKGTKNKKGFRVSSDVYGRKLYCSCGYSMSPEYTHVATEDKPAQMRYHCRWQINNSVLKRANLLKDDKIVCRAKAVSDVKLWLCARYVFDYIFSSGKDAVLKTLSIIESAKRDELAQKGDAPIDILVQQKEKLDKRLKSLIIMKADGEISVNEYKEMYNLSTTELFDIEQKIASYEMNRAKIEKKLFDMQEIQETLNTYVDFKGVRISDELVDMFVERIIYRGNDEFLWVMNLSGKAAGTESKYRISSYDCEYAESLKNDANFDIVSQFIIPLSDCKKYCVEKAKRGYKEKHWSAITIKIAVV